MTIKKRSIYGPIYDRARKAHEKGLMLVQGGTGLGKTAGVADYVTTTAQADKTLYFSARKQLLDELEEKVGKAHCCRQGSDLEQVRLVKQDEWEELFADADIQRLGAKIQEPNVPFLKKVQQHCKELRTSKYASEKEQGQLVSGIMRFFKCLLQLAHREDRTLHKHLCGYDSLRTLFPYMAFCTQPDKRLLLVTVHKAFYGLFDGKRNVGLQQLRAPEGMRYTIFLDEFDFLHEELLKLLCQEELPRDPFLFCEQFYRHMRDHKLPWDGYLLEHREVRERIERIVERIERSEQYYKLSFPDARHFTFQGKDKGKALKAASIFQTNFSIYQERFYLDKERRAGSLTLLPQAEGQGKDLPTLFQLVEVVREGVRDILHFYQWVGQAYPHLYPELVESVYKELSPFKRILRQLQQHAPKRKQRGSAQDQFLYEGYEFLFLKESSPQTDPEAVMPHMYALLTTPEALLCELCRHQLVFALSATASIPRTLRNFDLPWLQQQGVLLEAQPQDMADIRQANQQKQAVRGNQIRILQALGPAEAKIEPKLNRQVNDWIAQYTWQEDTDELFGNAEDPQRKRVVQWLATLEYLEKTQAQGGQLLFFISIRQIRAILQALLAEKDSDFCQVEEIKASEGSEWKLPHYRLRYRRRYFRLLCFDAPLAQQIAQNQEIAYDYYRLFLQQDEPLLLLSAYSSASHGVNLQHYSSLERLQQKESPDRDFTGLHLLDLEYFYLGSKSKEEDTEAWQRDTQRKADLYRLGKLLFSKRIGRGKFLTLLQRLDKVHRWNTEYRQTEDGVLNQFALILQAMGRIERVWARMPDQQVRVAAEVLQVLGRVLKDGNLEALWQDIAPYCSQNVRSVMEQVDNLLEESQLEIGWSGEVGLQAQNMRCRQAIQGDVALHARLREGRFSGQKAQEIRQRWGQLRKLALRHDFSADNPLNEQFACYVTTRYFHMGKLYLDDQLRIAAPNTVGITPWHLDVIYHPIQQHARLLRHFELRGYETAFGTHGHYPTPYFYQAVLAGAIGEEAIGMLLRRPCERESPEHAWKEAEKDGYWSMPLDAEAHIPDALFEVADLKVQGRPWLIDCKYYGGETIRNFSLSAEEDGYHSKLNDKHFRERALQKLASIEAVYGKEGRLFFINLQADAHERLLLLDAQFREVRSFGKARIAVVPGALLRGAQDQLHPAFKIFLQQCRQEYFLTDTVQPSTT